MKQAAVRSLSCEVVPEKEGQVYFGDSARGHFLSNTFFLKDAQARGFHRWYSVVVFMKDKHLLLNSWSFFEKHINQMVARLQKKADQVYSYEQSTCSHRKLRLCNTQQTYSTARSLMKLTDSTTVFAQLHLWFTWLLSVGAKRLEEYTPNNCLFKKSVLIPFKKNEFKNQEEYVWHLRKLRNIFGTHNFQKIFYSTLIGRQIIVRGPRIFVDLIIALLRLVLPSNKFRCVGFEETYKTPDVCNILGLDLRAAVPKSSDTLVRLDIVPSKELDKKCCQNLSEAYNFYNFLIKNESKLPEKLPSLLVKIDKALSDDTLSNRVVWLHFSSLMDQWLHTAEVIKEVKKLRSEVYSSSLMQFLGVQDQDVLLIEFWTS